MEYTDSLQEANSRLMSILLGDAVLTKAALVILCCVCLYLFSIAVYKMKRLHWDSIYFVLVCAFVFLWSVISVIFVFKLAGSGTETLGSISQVFIIPIPALLCLHVQRQVSYKEQNAGIAVAMFVIPAFLILLICRDTFIPGIISLIPAIGETLWYVLVFYLYVCFTLLRSLLQCLSVFYQMPRRTRRSTRFMLIGVLSVTLLIALEALWNLRLHTMVSEHEAAIILIPLVAPITFIFLLFSLYSALKVIPASEVIVTSREFVMGGLETAVLILNQKQQLLDWNKTDWGGTFPLPKPLFMEPFSVYRKRLLENNLCRVSPYNENIIIVEKDNVESHYLMRAHEAKSKKRSFGYVLEISEVTPIYTLLRQFEEIAQYDLLTKLYNRNAYLAYVSMIIEEENLPLLIFVGDINHLKQVNDDHGHLVGDQLIISVAEIIEKAMPPGAFVARVGGDEFVLILPKGSPEIAEEFARKALALCAEINHEVFGTPSISWGYSIMSSMDQSYNEVFNEADKVMYEYKKERYRFRSSGFLPD